MAKYAIVIVNKFLDSGSEEFTRECDDWSQVLEAMQDADVAFPGWRIMSVVHIEDFPRVMQDAHRAEDCQGGCVQDRS